MTFNRAHKKSLALFAVLAMATLLSAPPSAAVRAHAQGPKTTPADGSELAEAPKSLSFTFARPVRLTAVRLYDAESDEIELPGKRSLKPAKTRRIALPPLEAGTYRVQWRALSADGHPVDGEFGFDVSPAK